MLDRAFEMEIHANFGIHGHHQHLDDGQAVICSIEPDFAINGHGGAIFVHFDRDGDFLADTSDRDRAFDVLLAFGVFPLTGHFPRATGVLGGIEPFEHFFIAIRFVRIEVGKFPRKCRSARSECGIVARNRGLELFQISGPAVTGRFAVDLEPAAAGVDFHGSCGSHADE